MGESVFVAGFVITREEWDALGEDGQAQILAAQRVPAQVIRIAEGTGAAAIASKANAAHEPRS